MRIFYLFSLITCMACAIAVELPQAPLIQNDDAVVFVGDSITGQSVNIRTSGFHHVFRRAFDATRPGNSITLASLGGSGQGVGSWLGIMEKSKTEPTFLDVKGVDAHTVLNKDVDVIVIMLGMNDSLRPYMDDNDEGVAKYTRDYIDLIGRLRERCAPRVIGLATVTPNTEDPNSPKNLFLAKLGRQLELIAKKEQCVVLPVSDAAWATQKRGRTLKPDFHLTMDYVHPNGLGHAAIAYGMLSGLGEAKAAAYVQKHEIDAAFEKMLNNGPLLSYELLEPEINAKGIYKAKLAWYWSGTGGQAQAMLKAPKEWKVKKAKGGHARHGIINIEGPIDRLENKLLLRGGAGSKVLEHIITIPAPWLVGHGFKNGNVFEHGSWNYVPEKGKMPSEDDIMLGRYIDKTPKGWKEPLKWSRFSPTVDHTYGAVPGNFNMYHVDFSAGFKGAYGLRWLHSDRERSIRLVIGTKVFAGTFAALVKFNNEKVFSGGIQKIPGGRSEHELKLRKGWNLLAVKSNSLAWQWQICLDLESDESLDDLRVAISPQR